MVVALEYDVYFSRKVHTECLIPNVCLDSSSEVKAARREFIPIFHVVGASIL